MSPLAVNMYLIMGTYFYYLKSIRMLNQQKNEKETIIIHYHIAGSINIVGQGIGSNQGKSMGKES